MLSAVVAFINTWLRIGIVGFDGTSVILRASDGGTFRVPNHLFLESVVAVEASPEDAQPS